MDIVRAGAATEKYEKMGECRIVAPQAPPKGKMSEMWRRRPATHPLTTSPFRTPAFSGTRRAAWSHLIGLTAGVLIYQSQIAGKCTNSATTKLNETSPNASEFVKTGETAPKAPGK
eukprot:gene24422-biopygen2911